MRGDTDIDKNPHVSPKTITKFKIAMRSKMERKTYHRREGVNLTDMKDVVSVRRDRTTTPGLVEASSAPLKLSLQNEVQ